MNKYSHLILLNFILKIIKYYLLDVSKICQSSVQQYFFSPNQPQTVQIDARLPQKTSVIMIEKSSFRVIHQHLQSLQILSPALLTPNLALWSCCFPVSIPICNSWIYTNFLHFQDNIVIYKSFLCCTIMTITEYPVPGTIYLLKWRVTA